MRFTLLTAALLATYMLALQAQDSSNVSQKLPVRFSVFLPGDMKSVNAVTSLGLRGNTPPLSWDKDIQMSDPDGDGWWDVVAELPAPGYVEYKYITNGKDWEKLQGNRFYFQTENFLPGITDTLGSENGAAKENYKSLRFTREEIVSDIRLMEKMIFTLHPGIYKYTDSLSLKKAFDTAADNLAAEITLRDAYLLFTKLALLVKCGHTHTNFYNQNELIKTLLLNGDDKLPLTVSFIENKFVVNDNLSGNAVINRGSIISSFNGISSDSVISALKQYFRADGNNEAQKMSFMNLTGAGEFETFDVFFPLLFPPVKGIYNLELKNPGNNVPVKVSVNTISRDERKARLVKSGNAVIDSYDDLWEFRLTENNSAYLKIGTFVTWKMIMNWQEFLYNAFSAMRDSGTTSLIVDIRGNEGGSDEAAELLTQYLISKPSMQNKFKSASGFLKIPDELQRYITTWDNSVKDLTNQVIPENRGGLYYRKGTPDRVVMIDSNPDAFTGRTYLLTDGTNSSGTFLMTNFLKTNGLVVQVGEKTGGNKRGINGGIILFARLQNTMIEFDIPVFGQFPFGDEEDDGLLPDIEVKQNYDDFIRGEDSVLKKAKELIKEMRW